MMPVQMLREAIGMALVLFGGSVALLLSGAMSQLYTPQTLSGVSQTHPYPVVRVYVPPTSIFAQDSSY